MSCSVFITSNVKMDQNLIYCVELIWWNPYSPSSPEMTLSIDPYTASIKMALSQYQVPAWIGSFICQYLARYRFYYQFYSLLGMIKVLTFLSLLCYARVYSADNGVASKVRYSLYTRYNHDSISNNNSLIFNFKTSMKI